MRKFLISSLVFVFLLLFSISLPNTTFADPYDCLHYGTKQCITLHVSATCANGKPKVTLSWNNPHNDSTFNIVYSHGGHWYMKPIWSKVTSVTIPPYGAWKDGGTSSDKDAGFPATGGSFGAKITGGIPGSIGGSGITTGYSTPDSTTTMPNCTVPTPTPTHGPTPTPTQAPTPTTPPGPTATPTPVPHTYINIALQLTGIGQGGNLSPKHTTRNLHLQIYKAGVDPSQPNVAPLLNVQHTITYNSNNGYFTNAKVDIGTHITTGDYQILFKTPGYLRKAVINPSDLSTTTHLVAETNNLIPLTKLITGDVGPLFNIMDASDFYGIVGCYKDKASTSTCAVGSQIADINDDGIVDGVDLNYWLQGFQTLLNNNNVDGTGDGVTGD